MAHFTLSSHIRNKLVVGTIDTTFLSATSRILPGTAVLNGPVVIGATGGLGVDRATCMIGPPMGGLSAPASLEVIGNTNLLGPVSTISGFLDVKAVSNFFASVNMNSIETKNGADLKNEINIANSSSVFNGSVTINSVLTCGTISSPWLEAQLATARSLPLGKGFDIPHPSKPNTHRLRYICLEGPEVGAYIRGKLNNSNVIQLPEYWRDLVYPESITVHLTPRETYQELFVEKIEWGTKITIRNNLSSSINCDYIVYGERKTKDKLQPEYEGRTPNDYPGNNEEYSLAGWDYDRR